MGAEALVEYVALSQVLCVSWGCLRCVLCGSDAWGVQERTAGDTVKWAADDDHAWSLTRDGGFY